MVVKTRRSQQLHSQESRGQKKLGSTAKYRWLPMALILILATVLFTFKIEGEGLWLDELTSLQDADQSLFEVFKTNQLRPLYYILLMGWMRLGSSDAWLRSLSVMFALLSVFLLYRLGRRLVGDSEGLIAALLLTISPLFINHTQEIRMYVLSLCLGLAGTLCLVDALLTERPRRPSHRILAGWALFRLLAIHTVPLNVTLLLPDALMMILRFRQDRAVLTRFGKWMLWVFILWIPAMVATIDASSPSSTYASHHQSAVPPGPDELFRQLKFWTVWPFESQANAIVASFYKGFTLLIAGIVGAGLIGKRTSPQLWWVFGWFAIPLVPIIVFSYLSIPIWKSRYLLFVSPYLFILLAAGLMRLWRQWSLAATIVGAVYLFAAGGGLARYHAVQDRPDYKFNIETLEKQVQEGDGVIWSYHYQKPLDHYYDGTVDIHWRTLQEAKTPADIQQWVSGLPTGYDRYWVVLQPSNLQSDVEVAIARTYNIEQTFDYERNSKILLVTPLEKTAQGF